MVQHRDCATGQGVHTGVGLLLVTMVTSGCAFGTRRATLQPSPVASLPGSAPGSSAARGQIVLLTFADHRSNKRAIGEVWNGWGMQTADVEADRDISQWITQSVKAAPDRRRNHSGGTD